MHPKAYRSCQASPRLYDPNSQWKAIDTFCCASGNGSEPSDVLGQKILTSTDVN